MANENKTSLNSLEFEGYLKENTLAKMVTKTGKDAISGVLTIALSDKEDHRVRFMVCKFSNAGTANKTYDSLEKLLPENTISIATLLKSNPNATFDEVKIQASKVWARGQFECYDRKDNHNEIHTIATVRGISAGFKTSNSKTPFIPKAKFDIEAFVESIKDEKNKEGEDTGRVVVSLDIPDYYNETVLPFDFICENPSAISSIGQYQKGESGRFAGIIKNTREEVVVPGEKVEFLDGTTEDSTRTTYVFVNERIIERMTASYSDGDAKAISAEIIKKFMVNRQAKLDNLDITPDRPVGNNNGSPSAPVINSSKGFEL